MLNFKRLLQAELLVLVLVSSCGISAPTSFNDMMSVFHTRGGQTDGNAQRGVVARGSETSNQGNLRSRKLPVHRGTMAPTASPTPSPGGMMGMMGSGGMPMGNMTAGGSVTKNMIVNNIINITGNVEFYDSFNLEMDMTNEPGSITKETSEIEVNGRRQLQGSSEPEPNEPIQNGTTISNSTDGSEPGMSIDMIINNIITINGDANFTKSFNFRGTGINRPNSKSVEKSEQAISGGADP